MSNQKENLQFQTETRELLNLMIHSIYSNKEIFLRELISNASDALDKLRFEAITHDHYMEKDEALEIRLEVNKENRELIIRDNGIGMSRAEVVENIGTIAKSGTREALKKMKESQSAGDFSQLIGQFGVGFYSSFMVADKVTVITRGAGENQGTRWESDGSGGYTIEDAEVDKRGTTVILQLKTVDEENELHDYSDYFEIRRVIKKYSDFITYPIVLKEEKEEQERDKDGKIVEGGKTQIVVEENTINSMKPIWLRSQSDVTDDEYNEFYKHISHDWNDPAKRIFYRAEGRIEYLSLLFIPSKAPFDFYYQNYESGLHLYVKKVLIDEAFDDLLPKYLRFVKGVVESSDLPLNISREMLQQDRHITAIRKGLTRKVLDSLKEMLDKDKEKYVKFYEEFGSALKEGAASDFEYRTNLTSLLLYESSDSAEKTTLKDYFSRMKPEQEAIYYTIGESRDVVENSPLLERYKEKGIEILYIYDPVDEYVFQTLMEYEGKKIKSVAKGDLDIGSKEEKEKIEKDLKEKETDFKAFMDALKEPLKEEIKEIRLTSRLVSAPACIVGEEFDMSPQLEKVLQRTGTGIKTKRILEINPESPVIRKMRDNFASHGAGESLKDHARILMGYAYLSEGLELPNPTAFAASVARLMETAF